MELSSVIHGPIVTEKAERLKANLRTYVLRVSPRATKIDVRNALQKYFNVEVASVRCSTVNAKSRLFGKGQTMQKRHAYKKMLVTLTKESKALDLSTFQIHSS